MRARRLALRLVFGVVVVAALISGAAALWVYGSKPDSAFVHATIRPSILVVESEGSPGVESAAYLEWAAHETELAGTRPASTLQLCSEPAIPSIKTRVEEVTLTSSTPSEYTASLLGPQGGEIRVLVSPPVRLSRSVGDNPSPIESGMQIAWKPNGDVTPAAVNASLGQDAQAAFKGVDLDDPFHPPLASCADVSLERDWGWLSLLIVAPSHLSLTANPEWAMIDADSGELFVGAAEPRQISRGRYLEVRGDLTLILTSGSLELEGRSSSLEINGEQVLPARWPFVSSIPSEVVAGIAGVLAGIAAREALRRAFPKIFDRQS